MNNELELLLKNMKEMSEYRYGKGVNLRGASDNLSEWNFGYSEGVDYAIEKLEELIK